jgi:hypothetical protein
MKLLLKLKSFGVWHTAGALNWCDRIQHDALRWWLEARLDSVFVWFYSGSDEEAKDAIEWVGDWIHFGLPIRWDFLSDRQTAIAIAHFGVGPLMCIRKEAA